MAQPYISFEIISVQHEAPDPTLHKWMILIKLLTHKKLYQLLEMIKIVEGYPGEDNHTLSWSVTLSSWHVVVSRGNPVWDGSPEMAKELWVVKNEYLLKGRELFYHKRKKKKELMKRTLFSLNHILIQTIYPMPIKISGLDFREPCEIFLFVSSPRRHACWLMTSHQSSFLFISN